VAIGGNSVEIAKGEVFRESRARHLQSMIRYNGGG
jgi:hypothetical protein